MGFWEFVVIAIVGTIVLGPDKLPGALRKIVEYKRKLSQMTQGISAEVNEQLRIHELHTNLKEAEKKGFENLSPELQRSVSELQQAAQSVNSQTESNKPLQDQALEDADSSNSKPASKSTNDSL